MDSRQELEGISDIEHVLKLFAALSNTTIKLPDSVKSNSTVQDRAEEYEQSMMINNRKLVNLHPETLEDDLNDYELDIRKDTRMKSLAKFLQSARLPQHAHDRKRACEGFPADVASHEQLTWERV